LLDSISSVVLPSPPILRAAIADATNGHRRYFSGHHRCYKAMLPWVVILPTFGDGAIVRVDVLYERCFAIPRLANSSQGAATSGGWCSCISHTVVLQRDGDSASGPRQRCYRPSTGCCPLEFEMLSAVVVLLPTEGCEATRGHH
jgi:hypothetical protein